MVTEYLKPEDLKEDMKRIFEFNRIVNALKWIKSIYDNGGRSLSGHHKRSCNDLWN